MNPSLAEKAEAALKKGRALLLELEKMQPPDVLLQQIRWLGRSRDFIDEILKTLQTEVDIPPETIAARRLVVRHVPGMFYDEVGDVYTTTGAGLVAYLEEAPVLARFAELGNLALLRLAKEPEEVARLRRYLEVRREKPVGHQGDQIHGIRVGSEWEGELNASDIDAALRRIDALAAFQTERDTAIFDSAFNLGRDHERDDVDLMPGEFREEREGIIEKVAPLLPDARRTESAIHTLGEIMAKMREDSGEPGDPMHAFSFDHSWELLAIRADAIVAGKESIAPGSLADAVVAYDSAIRSCANDPEKMSSFCSADGDDLDALYAKMIDLARPTLNPEANRGD